ncbi:hypothetical protein POF73_03320 [Streptomyces sp. HD]|nr:hypothetical protein [Streptomyces sp. HD]
MTLSASDRYRYDVRRPEWNPEGPAASATPSCGAPTEAVRRVSVVAEASSPVRMDFSGDGTVLLRAGYGDDVATQRLPAVLSGAREVSVAFNPAYLLNALNSFEAPRLRLDLLGTGQRALLSGLGGEERDGDAEDEEPGAVPERHRHLLMSVKQLV